MKMSTQMKLTLLSGFTTLALALPAFAGKKNEEHIKLSNCPAAVQQTIKDNSGGGKVKEVEKETKQDGTVVYEADVKKSDGTKIEIKVAEDGKLIKVGNADEDDDDKD